MCLRWLSKLFKSMPNLADYELPSAKIRINPADVKMLPWSGILMCHGESEELPKGTLIIKGFKTGTNWYPVADTNSMEPGIDAGMLVICEPVDVDDLIIGDVIVYESTSNLVLHGFVAKRGK